MCGLIFASRDDNMQISNSLKKRFKKQSGRGTRGFGYLTIENGIIKNINRTKTEAEIMLKLSEESASEILFHHRLPTSTENLEDCTHPIVVKNKLLAHNYYLIHNGVLSNELELKEKYEKMGFEYTTLVETTVTTKTRSGSESRSTYEFNDSESLAIDVALYLDGLGKKIDSIGSIAFICIQTDKEDKVLNIFWGRNYANPLKMEKNGNLFFLKSEGDGEDAVADRLYSMNYQTKEIVIDHVDIGTSDFRSNFTQNHSTHPTQTTYGEKTCDTEYFKDESIREVDYDIVYESSMLSDGHLIRLNTELEQIDQDIAIARDMLNSSSDKTDKRYAYELIAESNERKKSLEEEKNWVMLELEKIDEREVEEKMKLLNR